MTFPSNAATISPMVRKSSMPSKPLKGILKQPSSACLQQAPMSSSSPGFTMRRVITNNCTSNASFPQQPTELPASSSPRNTSVSSRCVSFSDNMCRWQNQGSCHSLNANNSRSPPRGGGSRRNTPPPASFLGPARRAAQATLLSQLQQGNHNHVWGATSGTGRMGGAMATTKPMLLSKHHQPPRKPKRTTNDADIMSAPMRKPRRRLSNENDGPVAMLTTTGNQHQQLHQQQSNNVFQSSVDTFLMNARVPARTSSTIQSMDMS